MVELSKVEPSGTIYLNRRDELVLSKGGRGKRDGWWMVDGCSAGLPASTVHVPRQSVGPGGCRRRFTVWQPPKMATAGFNLPSLQSLDISLTDKQKRLDSLRESQFRQDDCLTRRVTDGVLNRRT